MSSERPRCPISSERCPYPDAQCNGACVDSWDGDDCYVREGDMWVWTGRESQLPAVGAHPKEPDISAAFEQVLERHAGAFDALKDL